MNGSTLPNLESIECRDGHVDLGSAEYPNLTYLELMHSGGMDDNFFSNFARKFPKLEDLYLGCKQIQRIDVSSPTLKQVRLDIDEVTMQEASFNLPNLVCIRFSCHAISKFPKLSFESNSGGWKSHIIWFRWRQSNIDFASWFLELNKFLAALNKSETSIDVDLYCKKDEEVGFNEQELLSSIESHSIIPVQGIKKFIISDANRWSDQFISSFASAILDCIFLICQPQTITFAPCKNYEIPELLYEMLTSGSLNHRGVADFEISRIIDRETSESSARSKDWNKFLEEFKGAEDISFHLEYCCETVPRN